MKERPILFSGEMIRAILAGTKTQTRRPVSQRILRKAHGDIEGVEHQIAAPTSMYQAKRDG